MFEDIRVENASTFEQLGPDPSSPWAMDENGVYVSASEELCQFIQQPIIVLERIMDIDTNMESVKIGWMDNGAMHTETVLRSVIGSAGKLQQLANHGLAVHFRNAGTLVDYLMHLLYFRKAEIPITYAVSSCGWKTVGNNTFFAAGDRSIGIDAPRLQLNSRSETAEMLGQYRNCGEDLVWLRLARAMSDYPIAAFGLAAAFLPPLMRDLSIQQNPIVDYAGTSTTGKSTLLRFAASVWGYPLEVNGGLIRPWDSTLKDLEDMAAMSIDLPFFLDDSQNADLKTVAQFAYHYANGKGRGRSGQAGGIRRLRGVLFSAGERRLADVSTYDGVQARILGFGVSPFGPDQGELTRRINETVVENYGFAGQRVLRRYFNEHETLLPRLRGTYQNSRERLGPRCSDDIAKRLADLCAAVEAAGVLANDILDLGWDVEAIVDNAFSCLVENRKSSSVYDSIEQLGSWLTQEEFKGAILDNKSDKQSGRSNFIGRYMGDSGSRKIALFTEDVKRFLKSNNYNYYATLSQWAQQGWIDSDKGRKDKKVRFTGKRGVYMVVLNEKGIKAACGDSWKADESPHADMDTSEINTDSEVLVSPH